MSYFLAAADGGVSLIRVSIHPNNIPGPRQCGWCFFCTRFSHHSQAFSVLRVFSCGAYQKCGPAFLCYRGQSTHSAQGETLLFSWEHLKNKANGVIHKGLQKHCLIEITINNHTYTSHTSNKLYGFSSASSASSSWYCLIIELRFSSSLHERKSSTNQMPNLYFTVQIQLWRSDCEDHWIMCKSDIYQTSS